MLIIKSMLLFNLHFWTYLKSSAAYMYQKASYQHDLQSCIVIFHRIIDNMPVTWCYDVADETSKYCSTGFPIGCHISEYGEARDACVTSVRFPILFSKLQFTLCHADWEITNEDNCFYLAKWSKICSLSFTHPWSLVLE